MIISIGKQSQNSSNTPVLLNKLDTNRTHVSD